MQSAIRSYHTDTHAELRRTAGDQASRFLAAVYGWMCAGLAITAVTAWLVLRTPATATSVTSNWMVFWTTGIVLLGIVFALAERVQQLTRSRAALLFVIYSALMGATLSIALLVFTGKSIDTTFWAAAGSFGALALYGAITKRNLGGVGQFLFMGLIGLVAASIVALFWHTDPFQFALSLAGVLMFAGLVTYDSCRLKSMAFQSIAGERSYPILAAITLYLDFASLFSFLLWFSNSHRDNDDVVS